MDQLFAPPIYGWDPRAAQGLSGRDEVLYRSHLVGSDPALTKEGGGNFSAKGVAADHLGRPARVLWMSSWGCDGATTTPEDFPVLRLDDLLRLRDSGPLTETQMIGHLVDSGLRGDQRRPGIETLTHAFIPAAHVDHCHPDAVIALTSFPGGREAADAEFGDEAIWFDYRQFDVGVARELAGRIAANPRCRFVLLANHGLFTWADTGKECYENSLEAVDRATRAVHKAIRRAADLGGQAVTPPPPDVAADLLADILPAIRGAVSAGTPGLVLHTDRSDAAVRFASSARGPRWTQDGPSCPDHVVTVGYRPLVLEETPTGAGPVLSAIERHRAWYDGYYERHVPAAARALGKRGNAPRAIVLPGLGVVTCGADAAKARLCADHVAQTMTVVRAADAAGGYRSLTEAQGAADEYWPLMRLKPQLRPPDGPLAGKVFLLAGRGDARTGEVADRLAAAGAHVALTGEEAADRAEITAVAAAVAGRHGERRAVALPSPASEPGRAARDAVLAYGGFDAVVDLTRSGGLVRAALPFLARQGTPASALLAHDGWTPGRLGLEVATLETAAAGGLDGPGVAGVGVSVHAVATADARVIARTAAFHAGLAGTDGVFKGTVLRSRGVRAHRHEDHDDHDLKVTLDDR
ncbi:class II aldolase/adducin family protein [Sphaerisporangium dianthi]|uniref:Class II aldolase/adducin family protein n=1 Tax=Sphaerisporangium dianthi TaxID=1436120 RepID=A0ABV9CJ15_9ACTN